MISTMRKTLIAAFLLTTLSSCIVTKKKYDDLLAQKVRTEADLADRTAQLDTANTDITDLTEKINALKQDTTNIGIDKRSASQRLAALEKEHEQLEYVL